MDDWDEERCDTCGAQRCRDCGGFRCVGDHGACGEEE